MNWPILLGIVLLVLVAVVAKLKQRGGQSQAFPYTQKQALFSPAERSFLGVLEQAVAEEYRVFGKVRVADVVEPQRGLSNGNRQKAFNRIKHFDFVLCSKDDLSVVCAVELDDQSHQQRKRQERDAFLVGLCRAIALPLIQVPAKRSYSVPELRAKVLETLRQSQQATSIQSPTTPTMIASKPAAVIERKSEPAPPAALQPEAPACPRCTAPLVRRQAKAGNNASQSFWAAAAIPSVAASVQKTHNKASEPGFAAAQLRRRG